jgi:hypothetical protein
MRGFAGAWVFRFCVAGSVGQFRIGSYITSELGLFRRIHNSSLQHLTAFPAAKTAAVPAALLSTLPVQSGPSPARWPSASFKR